MWSHQLYEIALKYYFFLKSFWTLLQFIATAPAVIMAAVLGLSRGLYYAVKIMKALEFSSSLFFLSLDYSVSMDTWLQFPLQSANQRLKTGSRSIAVLWRLYPSRHCFIFVSSSSIMQRRSTASVFFFFFHSKVSSFYCRLWFHRPALECHTLSVSEVPVKGSEMRSALISFASKEFSLLKGSRIEAAIWSFSTRKETRCR